ncbi:MAG: flagellin [Pseudomonadales bacterium]|jgi:flagellin|nr:flagellin [Pseudomonadales bacterium]
MSQVINTNFVSLNAQRNLNRSSMDLQTSLQRLSSGLRINSAKDDAAGLAISERFTSQIRGLNQAVRNANDGVSLAQTAEGALGEMTNNLQRIRELAVQSVNGTNSASDRAALQSEVDQLVSEIERVASQTSFNGVRLLDGSFTSQSFQVGANAGETIGISIGDARADRLGSNATTTTTGTTDAVGDITAITGLTINGAAITTAADGVSTAADANSAIALAAAVNDNAATTGVSARANATTFNAGAVTADTAGLTGTDLQINGVNIEVDSIAAGDANGNLREAINAVSNQTGVTAELDGDDNLILTAADGRNIQLQTDGDNAGDDTVLANFLLDGGVLNNVVTGTVTFDSDEAFVVGGTQAATTGQAITAGTFNVDTTNSVANVDITSADSASLAITNVDRALATVNGLRAELGAVQNRFESTIANLTTSAENATAARSRIQDADFAKETAALTRAQILQQAGTAMLAQANAAPQGVLSLLQ